MRTAVSRILSRVITSPARRARHRRRAERWRRLTGQPHRVHYFHRDLDPYCDLMIQVLPGFTRRFRIEIVPHVVRQPDPVMVPRPAALAAYAREDATRLARLYDLTPPAARSADRSALLAAVCAEGSEAFFAAALAGPGSRIDASLLSAQAAAGRIRRDEKLLRRRGHYLGATLWYAGEWYWGLDRLHHLERRLTALGLGDGDGPRFDKTVRDPYQPRATVSAGSTPLVVYLSVRSPYSYLALVIGRRFARAHGLHLELRPILPMVTRGMAVPRAKRFYIVRDAMREAEREGIRFGRIADPLGAGVERVLAVAHRCADQEALANWLECAATAIFADGIDVATDAGLAKVAARAGLDDDFVIAALRSEAWRDWVGGHRDELDEAGLWGVPCLRLGDTWTWGQDRFWVIRDAL